MRGCGSACESTPAVGAGGWLTDGAGTDAAESSPSTGVAHGASLHREPRYLVAAGLTPTRALHAATAGVAARFRLSDRGRIAPGPRTDLVLLSGNPTRNIDSTLGIREVWRSGGTPTGGAGQPPDGHRR